MAYLLMLVCGLLLYGSLYPWQFHAGPPLGFAVRHAFLAWPAHFGLGDLKDVIVNLVIYAPVGFLGYLAQRHGFRLWRAAWPVGLAFLLSASVETLQHYCARRVPSLLDILCNTAGALAGVVVASIFEATLRSRWPTVRRGRLLRPSSALMLLLLWSFYYVLPLRPVPSGLMLKLRMLAHGPVWSWTQFTGAVLIWWTISELLHSIAPPAIARWLLLLSGPATVLARIVVPGRTFSWDEAAGTLAGVLLALLLEPEFRFKPVLLALAWMAWLSVDELRPFHLLRRPHAVNWIPFLDLLHTEWVQAILVLLRKCSIYGTLFWCLERTGLRLSRVFLMLLPFIAALEMVQTRLPGRVPSTTDIALVLLMGALLWRLERKYGPPGVGEGVFHRPS